jgi:hypothetical protein
VARAVARAPVPGGDNLSTLPPAAYDDCVFDDDRRARDLDDDRKARQARIDGMRRHVLKGAVVPRKLAKAKGRVKK